MVLITIVNGVYKPTYNWGAPPCTYICCASNSNILSWNLNACTSQKLHQIHQTHRYWYILILVGGWPTPLKNMLVSWDYYSQYMEKEKMVIPVIPLLFRGFQPSCWWCRISQPSTVLIDWDIIAFIITFIITVIITVIITFIITD